MAPSHPEHKLDGRLNEVRISKETQIELHEYHNYRNQEAAKQGKLIPWGDTVDLVLRTGLKALPH
jgi:hypothetical protein